MPEPRKSRGESPRHLALKHAAFLWARDSGYRSVAFEVSLPNSNFRADVAAYRSGRYDTVGRTAVFECKQSRPDFLNHARPEEKSLAQLARLNARLATLSKNLAVHHPHLSLSDSLFPEYNRHDLSTVSHPTYQKLRKQAQSLERTLYARTKFDRLARYRCADACYLVATPGLFEIDELPAAWGLLVPDTDEPPYTLTLLRKPAFLDAPPEHRLHLLHRLANAATRETARSIPTPEAM